MPERTGSGGSPGAEARPAPRSSFLRVAPDLAPIVAGAPAGGLAVGGTGGPRALTVDQVDPAAVLVGMSEARPRGARLLAPAGIGAFARGAVGRAVVVVGVEDEGAAAVAERLAALGVDAGWLVGGVGAWEAAGRALFGSAGEAT